MKRRRSLTPSPFPLTALIPEMQAAVLTHLPLQDLLQGAALTNRTLCELEQIELRQRLCRDVFVPLPPCLAALARQIAEEFPAEERAFFLHLMIEGARGCGHARLAASLAYKWWMSGATMALTDLLDSREGPVVLRAFSPHTHGLNATRTRPHAWHWSLRLFGAEEPGRVGMAVPIVALATVPTVRQYGRVHYALRAVNRAITLLDAVLTKDAYNALGAALDRLLYVSFLDLGLDLALQCGNSFMSFATGCFQVSKAPANWPTVGRLLPPTT